MSVTNVITAVETALNNYITDAASQITTQFGIWGGNLVALYAIFLAVSMMYGGIQLSVRDLAYRIGLPAVVMIFVTTYGTYEKWFVDAFMDIPAFLGGKVAGATGNSPGGSIDFVYQRVFELATKIWEQGDGYVAPGITMLILLSVGIALIATTATLLVLTKIAITVLLAVGPLFIIALLFGPTRNMFQTWLQQLFAYGLLQLFIGATAGLLFSLVEQSYKNLDKGGVIELVDISALVIVMAITFTFLLFLPNLAQSIAGGIGLPGVQDAKDAEKRAADRVRRAMPGRGGGGSARQA